MSFSRRLLRPGANFFFGKQCFSLQPLRHASQSPSGGDGIMVQYRHGFPVISFKLPSLNERCSFTVHPHVTTVGQFLEDVKAEDKSIHTAVIHGKDDIRVSSSTKINHVLLDGFKLTVNDVTYDGEPPKMEGTVMSDDLLSNDIKQQVANLYNSLNVDEFSTQTKQEAQEKLEDLKAQLEPFESAKLELESRANFRSNLVVWGGLALMGAQFGILARLTWWEYSWDIMEPVTYFITYGTAMVMYGYFILTKQEYVYPDAKNRQYLRFLHRAARKTDFDVVEYNSLCMKIAKAEEDLLKLS